MKTDAVPFGSVLRNVPDLEIPHLEEEGGDSPKLSTALSSYH